MKTGWWDDARRVSAGEAVATRLTLAVAAMLAAAGVISGTTFVRMIAIAVIVLLGVMSALSLRTDVLRRAQMKALRAERVPFDYFDQNRF